MEDLIKSIIANGFVRYPFGAGWYYRKGSIDLVDNTHLLEGGYLTPLIICRHSFREERQFDNVKTAEQLNIEIRKAQKINKMMLEEIQLILF